MHKLVLATKPSRVAGATTARTCAACSPGRLTKGHRELVMRLSGIALAVVSALMLAACGEVQIVEVEVVKEVPVEITKEVPVEVEIIRTVEVPVEKIVEKIVTKEVIKIVVATPTPTATPEASVETDDCLESDERYLLDLAARHSAFEVREEIAGSTPRMSLGNIVADMGDERIDLLSVRPTQGCTGAYTVLDLWMTTSIEGFQAFLGQSPDVRVAELLHYASELKILAAIRINRALEDIGKAPVLAVPSNADRDDISMSSMTPAIGLVEGSLNFNVEERDDVWWTFVYEFEVKNNLRQRKSVYVIVKFLDAQGVVVEETTASEFSIPPYGTIMHRDSTRIAASEAPRVIDMRIEQR